MHILFVIKLMIKLLQTKKPVHNSFVVAFGVNERALCSPCRRNTSTCCRSSFNVCKNQEFAFSTYNKWCMVNKKWTECTTLKCLSDFHEIN
jgi:hypothetical protein